jgi:hypothetical protein
LPSAIAKLQLVVHFTSSAVRRALSCTQPRDADSAAAPASLEHQTPTHAAPPCVRGPDAARPRAAFGSLRS